MSQTLLQYQIILAMSQTLSQYWMIQILDMSQTLSEYLMIQICHRHCQNIQLYRYVTDIVTIPDDIDISPDSVTVGPRTLFQKGKWLKNQIFQLNKTKYFSLTSVAIHLTGVAIIMGLSKLKCPKINQMANEHLPALIELSK